MHVAPGLRRDRFADAFNLDPVAAEHEVIGRALLEPREGQAEPTRLMQRRGAEQMEAVHEARIAAQRRAQPFAQTLDALIAEALDRRYSLHTTMACRRCSATEGAAAGAPAAAGKPVGGHVRACAPAPVPTHGAA